MSGKELPTELSRFADPCGKFAFSDTKEQPLAPHLSRGNPSGRASPQRNQLRGRVFSGRLQPRKTNQCPHFTQTINQNNAFNPLGILRRRRFDSESQIRTVLLRVRLREQSPFRYLKILWAEYLFEDIGSQFLDDFPDLGIRVWIVFLHALTREHDFALRLRLFKQAREILLNQL